MMLRYMPLPLYAAPRYMHAPWSTGFHRPAGMLTRVMGSDIKWERRANGITQPVNSHSTRAVHKPVMEFDNLNFWSPESVESGTDLLPIPGYTSAIFSPLQIQYESLLDTMEMEMEMELMEGSARESTVKEKRSEENEEEEEEEEDQERGGADGGGGMEEGILGNGGCKNLLSERNRRKRLSQQLLALRSLVPCITKMDKRSILMDAATYLQNLHREIDQIKHQFATPETSESSTISSVSNSPSPQEAHQCHESSPLQHQILNISVEEMDERMFAIKVIFRRAHGMLGQVQRVIESLGLNISNTWTHEIDRHQMITTSFVNVKKQINMTSETLKVQISKAALKFGLEVNMDD